MTTTPIPHPTRLAATLAAVLTLTACAPKAPSPTALPASTPAAAAPAAPAHAFAGSTPLEWSVRLADSEQTRLSKSNRMSYPTGSWDYANFLFLNSLLHLDARIGQKRYHPFVQRTADTFLDDEGRAIRKYKLTDHNIDYIAPGRALLTLHKITQAPRYRNAAQVLRDQLNVHPRTTDGGFWHKQRYPHQMWLDGLFMASPFYTEFGALFNEPADFDDVAKQIKLMDQHSWDATAQLHYHGYDESRAQDWADKTTGHSPNFWSRAIGWYAMALVDVLENFPENHPERPDIIAILRKTLAGVINYQDPETGLWWQVTAYGGREGNYREATASCMFVYALAKAANHGWIERDPHLPAILKAYQGIIDHLIKTQPDGTVTLTQCCKVSGLGYGRDGSYAYYISEPIVNNDAKGTGPFVFAGIELDRLLRIHTPATAIPPAPTTLATPSAPETPPAATTPSSAAAPAATDPWTTLMPAILARITPPKFPDREYPITRYGAPTDGQNDATTAIRAAIDACHRDGGGRVLIPPGAYHTGPIHLKSNVNLHLEEGATLLFHTDPKHYMPPVYTRWEGVELMNYSPLIYAYGQENIAITGKGTLDGQADYDNWWGWVKLDQKTKPKIPLARASRNRLMAEANRPIAEMDVTRRIYGLGEYIRPPFIQPYHCKNILIEDITILRSPFWEINPVLSQNITIRGVTIRSHGPNNDGCDPESSRDILIENCSFDTGDDCIAIKSGRNNDGRRVATPSENIIIRNCDFKDGHGGVTIGSEISGDCRNVFAENCRMDSPHLDQALRFKTNAVRGGVIENIYFRNIEVGRVAKAVLHVDFRYEEGAKGDHMPILRNVVVEKVTSKTSPHALYLRGLAQAPIRDITIRDCTFENVEKDDLLEHVENITKTNIRVTQK
jgi:unsaturated rhamnogalacturonyl hydrolase